MKTALVLGGGGFIGSHMVKKLKAQGFWVRAVDLKYPEFSATPLNPNTFPYTEHKHQQQHHLHI